MPNLITGAQTIAHIVTSHATHLLDTVPEDAFDRVTRLAIKLFDVPTALISLIDSERHWIQSRAGTNTCEIACDASFFTHVLASDMPLIVPDALSDPRFAHNPLVTGAPHIRFYAGCPIYSIDRKPIGALYLIADNVRSFNEIEVAALRDLARTVDELIAKRQIALTATKLLTLLRKTHEQSALLSSHCIELEHFLDLDVLTNLPNHDAFRSALNASMSRWAKDDQQGLVAYMRLAEQPSAANPHSHYLTDDVIATFIQRLMALLEPKDVMMRMGKEGFLILIDRPIQGLSHKKITEEFSSCQKLLERVCGDEALVSCTVGYACYPMDGTDTSTLISAASVAMQYAHKAGRGKTEGYSPARTPNTGHLITLETQLRMAVKRQELLLHYQPKVELRTGRITGVEALVRWQHADLGMVPPAQFIPLAEETGLISAIGEWVLHAACEQIRQWHADGLGIMPIAVNLSSRQFLEDDIVPLVHSAMRRAGLGPGTLELELTESFSMGNPDKSAARMLMLRDLGISLAIDDFGTGYSSLSYLKRLPINKIKIDRSFILDLTESAEALAIVQAIIAMAHRLNMKVVAEGVETEKQLSFLALNLCDEIQGYFFSRPLDTQDCTKLLASGRTLTVNEHSSRAIAALFGCR